jgi:hypothetical protein
MSILTRFMNRLWPQRLARDLEDEVAFHIDLRATEYLKTGMTADEAMKEAHEQFGDLDTVVANMRKERLTSVPMLVTITALFMAVVMLWIAQQQLASTNLRTPAVRPVSIFKDPDRPTGSPPPPPPPPRPGRGPTWTQFEALAKGPGTYSPGRLIDDEGRLINDKAKTR